MKLVMVCVIFLLLSACSSPSIRFIGDDNAVLMVEGDQFKLWRSNDYVQIVRTNVRSQKQQIGARRRFIKAIEMATRCRVVQGSLVGDTVLVNAAVNCEP